MQLQRRRAIMTRLVSFPISVKKAYAAGLNQAINRLQNTGSDRGKTGAKARPEIALSRVHSLIGHVQLADGRPSISHVDQTRRRVGSAWLYGVACNRYCRSGSGIDRCNALEAGAGGRRRSAESMQEKLQGAWLIFTYSICSLLSSADNNNGKPGTTALGR